MKMSLIQFGQLFAFQAGKYRGKNRDVQVV